MAVTTLAGRLRDPDDPLHLRLAHPYDGLLVVADSAEQFAHCQVLFAELDIDVADAQGAAGAWSRSGRPLNRGLW